MLLAESGEVFASEAWEVVVVVEAGADDPPHQLLKRLDVEGTAGVSLTEATVGGNERASGGDVGFSFSIGRYNKSIKASRSC